MLSELFSNKIFQTIISGLFIFIISQYLLELFIKPRVELRKLKILLSEKLLTYQSKITNGNLSSVQIQEIKDISARLLSTAWVIYFGESKKNVFVNISQNVNGLIVASESKHKEDIPFSVKCLNNLRKYKFLKVNYEEKL
jgi:hypothetical protein